MKQQLRNTSSGTVRIARTSFEPSSVSLDSTTPPLPSARNSPWPAMCTMRSGLASSALTTCSASGADQRAGVPRHLGDLRAPRRARPAVRGKRRLVALRLADHQHASSRPAPTGWGGTPRCAACAAAACASPTAAARPTASGLSRSSSSHGSARCSGSSSQHHRAGAGQEGLDLHRHQQLEQAAADLRVGVGRVRRRRAPVRRPAWPASTVRAPRCARAACRACTRSAGGGRSSTALQRA